MIQHCMMTIDSVPLRVYSFNTIVVGSGAAGLNAAGYLKQFGQPDIAVLTEGMKMGTSRNTGSDKQTYYRLTLSGDQDDSIHKMAATLFQGGSMDGDIALCEAASSTRCFYHLLELGVPFPHNRYGEFVGYKTDHDPCSRGASVGPLTSKYMTECLERDINQKEIPVFDGYQVIEILTVDDGDSKRAVGLLALNLDKVDDPDNRYALFSATNIVYATGGEAGMYKTSVYPESQTGGTGTALRAGVMGKNLTESQYGIASTKFRWNLSGSYQQVIPRYVSTDQAGGDEREFLDEYFSNPGSMLDAIFLKGYQWPFDPRKLENEGSSLIDLLVYNETAIKGRRVWLDFRRNPTSMDFSKIGEITREYLENCGALQGTPIARLAYMNQPAIDLYQSNGIDLHTEMLEIAVCAQHNNGGLAGNVWWESNVKHFFPVGEVNGTHGIYRPGGSALNSGQVGSFRASQFIANNYTASPLPAEELILFTKQQVNDAIALGEHWLKTNSTCNPVQERLILGERMSQYGAVVRSLNTVRSGIEQARKQLEALESQGGCKDPRALPFMYRNRDLLTSQIVYLTAMEEYIASGGGSRGSYLVQSKEGQKASDKLPELFRHQLDSGARNSQIQEITYRSGECHITWRDVRPLPHEAQWFETVWNLYMQNKIVK